jgi:peroxiredoxin
MSILSGQQVQLGPVTLGASIFLLLVAALLASLLVFYRHRRDRARRRLFFDRLSTAALLVLLGWKLFPLFYSFSDLITRPLTLLYTPGGTPGIIFGLVLGLLYVGFKIVRGKQKATPDQHLLSPAVLFALSFVGLSALLLTTSSVLWAEQREQPAASFEAATVQGKSIALDDLRGKTVILNFWATWCPPCRAEIPTLNAFNAETRGTRTVLIGLASGSSQTQDTVQPFMKAEGIRYPVILDTTRTITARYGVHTLPTSIVISPEGKIVERRTGAVDRYWLRSHLAAPRGPVLSQRR